jgi:nucleoside-diphosphate-sugar epimerase
MVKGAFSFPVSVDFDGKPFEDRDHPVLDISAARELLGWTPTFTLEKGIHETVLWYEKYFATTGGIQT